MIDPRFFIKKLPTPFHMFGQTNKFIVYYKDGTLGKAVYFATDYQQALVQIRNTLSGANMGQVVYSYANVFLLGPLFKKYKTFLICPCDNRINDV